jgi:16S rRNA G527 N7-methylase RsmG
VAVIRGRAETVDGRWDVAVARAVAPLVHLVPLARRLLRRPSSELLAFKGRAVSDEVEEARAVLARSGSVVTIHEVGVDDWRTTVAVVTRGAQTPPDGRRSASREEVRRRA